MPSMEERMTAVERALRLQDREQAVQRQPFITALSAVHNRIDDMATKEDIRHLVARIEARIDTVQADVTAIFTLLKRKFPD